MSSGHLLVGGWIEEQLADKESWTGPRFDRALLQTKKVAAMADRHFVYLLLWAALACNQPRKPRPQGLDAAPDATAAQDFSGACRMPLQPTTILDHDGAVLETWELRLESVLTSTALPQEPSFLSYRAAIEGDGADLMRPIADPPVIQTEAEAAVWRDEYFNNDLAFDEGIGSIDPISCLDALLFSRQASRFSQLEHPTEFVASVLRRDSETGTDLLVVFGAGSEMFVPKEVYGFDVVRDFLAEGWTYWYVIHNHTVRKNGDLLALGVPVPSTSDVQLSRNLADELGLDSVRVTNGFYTFSASVGELGAFRAAAGILDRSQARDDGASRSEGKSNANR